MTRSGRRWRTRALDVLCFTAVVAVGARIRTGWTDLRLHADWPWFLRLANASPSDASGAEVAFLYTSFPSRLFGLVLRVAGDLQGALWAWGLFGALAGGVLFVALRQEVGRWAAAGAGAIVALSTADALTTTGLKSPYAISTWTALAVLGAVGCARDRGWGPTLLVLGSAMAAAHHVGVWPLSVSGSLIAVSVGVRLARRRRPAPLIGALTAGAAAACWVLVVDGARLLRDAEALDGRYPVAPRAEMLSRLEGWWSAGSPPAAALCGLNATPTVLLMAFFVTLTAGMVGLARSVRALGYRDGACLRQARLAATLAVLTVSSVAPFVHLAVARGRLEVHHLVGALPVLLAAAGVGSAVLLPRWPRALVPIAAAAGAGAWLAGAAWTTSERGGRWLCGGQPATKRLLRSSDEPPQATPYGFAEMQGLATSIRDDLSGPAQVFGWLPRSPGAEPGLFVNVVAEVALGGMAPGGSADSCYLVAPSSAGETLGGRRALATSPSGSLAAFALSCADLTDLSSTICSEEADWVAWRRARVPMGPTPVLPCATPRFR